MSLIRLLSMITRTGTMTEPVADAPIETRDGFVPPACLRGSVQVRHVDAGSCNGCEIELGAAFGPVYDAERFGARLVASPRHADVVTVTGVVTQNMVEPLLNTIDATPNPRVIVSIGDCTRGCGVFAGSYAVAGSVDDFVEVDVHVPGCPPAPEAIIAALRAVTRR
ncbi:NADH-quinone oxidoreductase subunit NuoB [Propionicimonas sp.]|uniref:NADH-quinone oxidoreductase subunit B family protein n=1 Tax=Propionicimonas sp. TaxID=1955623 RepID=UPI001DC08C44|nr:NADH-quinone oxidoreductase subunit NuoB [Propionicimonas sp.]MBU3976882.1 NADH-quinone oxidoreductase subunit NuoB [Actinomycetota bacterium]MBU3986977.1 NADH-quinone oxidoreductase subunit NuoB [Actinomycetota bacterium]MBU4006889.1 NADH-quinone oxidoreductase subunit NuoB [Actinomycetota bacterium]MBU4065589.1 NADH-quinone oxidoreductase subunit NuoB [Actinomycetota bacterium]MBU4092645.1 NADH-quinone oxidoreductase subunit NuoB [Actinomycetota bacterium]